LKNNFTTETKNNKVKADAGSQKSVQGTQAEQGLPDEEESRRSDIRIKPASRGSSRAKNRGNVDSKRVGSTGGSSSRDQEFFINNNSGLHQTTVKQTNLDESFKAGVTGKIPQSNAQTKEQSAEKHLQKLFPMVRNPSREHREVHIGNIISASQTPANDRQNINMLVNGSLTRDIQTPSGNSATKTQVYKPQPPPFKNQPAIHPRADNFLNGSFNKEAFEEKLNNIANNMTDNARRYRTNNFIEGDASTSPKHSRKVTHQMHQTNGIRADNDIRNTNTINRE